MVRVSLFKEAENSNRLLCFALVLAKDLVDVGLHHELVLIIHLSLQLSNIFHFQAIHLGIPHHTLSQAS